MGLTRLRLVACAALALLVAASPHVARTADDAAIVSQALRILPRLKTLDVYGPYVATEQAFHYPEFTGAYLRALHASVSNDRRTYNDWMTGDGGLAAPLIIVQEAGRNAVLWSRLCMPHNCSDNTMQILFAPGSRTVWGIFRVDGHIGVLGTPSISQKALLLALNAARSSTIRNEFGLPLDAQELPRARAWIKLEGASTSHFFSPLSDRRAR